MSSRLVYLIGFSLMTILAIAGAATAMDGDPNPEATQWLDVSYDLVLDDEMQELALDGRVDIHKVTTDNDLLRRQCGGSSCSADDLREAYQRAGDSGRQQIVDGLESAIEDRVRSALGSMAENDPPSAEATVSRQALEASPSGSEYLPPIPVNATGSVSLGLLDEADVTPEQGRALFAMGARVTQPIEQTVDVGTNMTLSLSLADHVAILDAEGEILDDGGELRLSKTNWKGEQAARIQDVVTLGDPDVVVPDQSDAEVEVTLDVSAVNVAYSELITGNTQATAEVGLSVDGRFRAIENPQTLDRVELDYLSADALRIALEHDLLDGSELMSIEDAARQQIEGAFHGMVGENVEVEGGFTDEDLSPDAVGEPPGSGDAIDLELAADARVPFPPETGPDASQDPPTAPGFTVTTIAMGDLEIPRPDMPEGVATTISLVLPEGLALEFTPPPGYVVEEQTRDGRQAYAFTPTGDANAEANAVRIQDSQMVVNHPFVWHVFWPLLVVIVLLLVVLPAVVIGLTIRRRRNQGPPRSQETPSPISGSQASERSGTAEDS